MIAPPLYLPYDVVSPKCASDENLPTTHSDGPPNMCEQAHSKSRYLLRSVALSRPQNRICRARVSNLVRLSWLSAPTRQLRAAEESNATADVLQNVELK